MKRLILVLALASVYLGTTASFCNPNLTPTQQVQNVAGKIEQTADQMVLSSKSLNATNPTVMTDARLIAVALAGDKIGRVGTDLGSAIDAYNSAKTAGLGTSTQASAVNAGLAALTQALNDLGKQIPQGTIAAIDTAATTILGLVAQIKLGLQ